MEATGVLSVHRVMNVGDTVLDLQAGGNAGVAQRIGVLSPPIPAISWKRPLIPA